MKIQFLVTVEVNHLTGKFASREEIEEQVREALESADPGGSEGGEGGEYETADWSVDEYVEPKLVKMKRAASPAAKEPDPVVDTSPAPAPAEKPEEPKP